MKKIFSILFAIITCHYILAAQDMSVLRRNIESATTGKNVKVGVAILGPSGSDTLSINGSDRFPMQSVFKFHIALAILAEVDKGVLALDQMITIREDELLPGIYSPIRDKYPKGTTMPLAEVIEYTVSKSDNVGCDLLIRMLGGPMVVEAYFHQRGFNQLSIKINEEVMQSNWDQQYLNWTTPLEANAVLKSFYENSSQHLSPTSHAFIWDVMRGTETGKGRLKGLLPEGTTVAHKTGWSGTNADGLTAAVNNIGVVTLPDGRHFYISVFVTNSREDFATNERIIAEIARAAWDYFEGN